MNQRLYPFDPTLAQIRLHLALEMLAGFELHHDHVIRRDAEFGAQDVGAEVTVEAACVCGNTFNPFFVARFPAWADAMVITAVTEMLGSMQK